MPDLTLDEHRVAFGTGGSQPQPGRPYAVLLHGAGADHTVWASQARFLANHGWNVAAPDLPGHGLSEDLPSNSTIAAIADWLDAFIGALHEAPIAVIGHSMGACVALTWAARPSSKPIALALLGAGEGMPVNDVLLDDTLSRPARAHAFITAFGHGRQAHFGGSQSPGLWTLGGGRALLERSEPEVLHRDFAACNNWRSDGVAEQIRCPSLVIAGAADRMTPARSGRSLAARIPNCQFEVLPDVGHMMTSEAPREVTTILNNFLQAHTPEP